MAISIHHERHGSGEPLLLVHGLGGTTLTWQPVLDRLAAEREVITVDLPGFGRSEPLPADEPPSAANLARALIALCTELGIERPHLGGNSLGGWVGLEMAKAGAAASVCAISPAGLWRRPLGPRRFERQRIGRRLLPVLPALLATARGRAALLGRMMARPERVPPEVARALVLDYVRSPGYEAANAQMRSRVFERRELVTVPVTIAWGVDDQIVGRPSRTRRPVQTRYLEMPGWGHTPTWDDPAGVAGLLLETSAAALGSGAVEEGEVRTASE